MNRFKDCCRRYRLTATKVFLVCFFLYMVVFPLIMMLMNIRPESIKRVVSNERFGKAVVNSLVSTTIATVITLLLSYFIAAGIERTNIKFKEVLSVIIVTPMLIPSISHGMALLTLFGNNGIITNAFGLTTSIYGINGIVTGSVMYSFPFAFLMFRDVLKYQDRTPYEAARVLGIPWWNQCLSITLPYIRKPIITVTITVFTAMVTDYGVPLFLGGKFVTLPIILYID